MFARSSAELMPKCPQYQDGKRRQLRWHLGGGNDSEFNGNLELIDVAFSFFSYSLLSVVVSLLCFFSFLVLQPRLEFKSKIVVSGSTVEFLGFLDCCMNLF